eukprot:COSAG06_NODE_57930_length_278_cov_1.715084_1_plen_29_part_10
MANFVLNQYTVEKILSCLSFMLSTTFVVN